MKIEIYGSAFSLISNSFDYKSALNNFCNFADRVTVAVNTSNDGTFEALSQYKTDNKIEHLNLVQCDYSYDSIDFDGQIKNFALQNTFYRGLVLLDLDEFIPLSQKPLWIQYAEQLYDSDFEALMIPSINLCGSFNTYKDIGHKFYLHKRGLRRGIVNYAKLPNGKIDINLSDSTELVNNSNNLPKIATFPNDLESLKTGNIPYVFHQWAVNYDQRVRQNEFWKPVWENRAGRKVDNIILSKSDLEKISVFQHGLKME